MKTETKCFIAEQVCEGIMGGAVGIILSNNILPKCNNNAEKVVVTLGTTVVGWMLGRSFAKQFYAYCDYNFGTDFEETRKNL
jgi:hypothetical protein